MGVKTARQLVCNEGNGTYQQDQSWPRERGVEQQEWACFLVFIGSLKVFSNVFVYTM
jgi:hypothetical protein